MSWLRCGFLMLLVLLTTQADNTSKIINKRQITKTTITTTTPCPKIPPSAISDINCLINVTRKVGECRWKIDKEHLYQEKVEIHSNVKEALTDLVENFAIFKADPNTLYNFTLCLHYSSTKSRCPDSCRTESVVSEAHISKDSFEIDKIDESSINFTMKVRDPTISNVTVSLLVASSSTPIYNKTLRHAYKEGIFWDKLKSGRAHRVDVRVCSKYRCNVAFNITFATYPSKPKVTIKGSQYNQLFINIGDKDMQISVIKNSSKIIEENLKFNLEYKIRCVDECFTKFQHRMSQHRMSQHRMSQHRMYQHRMSQQCLNIECLNKSEIYYSVGKINKNDYGSGGVFNFWIRGLQASSKYSLMVRKKRPIGSFQNPDGKDGLVSGWSNLTCSTGVGEPLKDQCGSEILKVNKNQTEVNITQTFSSSRGPLISIVLLLDSTKDLSGSNPCNLQVPLFGTQLPNTSSNHPSSWYVAKRQTHNLDQALTCEIQRMAILNGPTCSYTDTSISVYNSRRYSIKLRAYTSPDTFSETEPVTFEISHDYTLLIITMILITIILIFIILILACCLYSYMRKNVKKRPRNHRTVKQTTSSFGRFIANKKRRLSSYKLSHSIPISKPIKLDEFMETVVTMEKDSGLKYTEEFEDLRYVGKEQSVEVSLATTNCPKNRFANILPYDITRVKLPPIGKGGSDYINASWIPGFNFGREFIATQGPVDETVDDFWWLVWTQKSSVVVMLTQCFENSKVKCVKYWPEEDKEEKYGRVEVKMVAEDDNELCCVREFQLTCGGEKRKVLHFHFLSWPDMGVPDANSLMAFRVLLRKKLREAGGEEDGGGGDCKGGMKDGGGGDCKGGMKDGEDDVFIKESGGKHKSTADEPHERGILCKEDSCAESTSNDLNKEPGDSDKNSDGLERKSFILENKPSIKDEAHESNKSIADNNTNEGNKIDAILPSLKESSVNPIIIHCSAGVGRSGTFIALDHLVHQMEQGKVVDVYGVVYQLRMARVMMVQTEQQYILLYRCVKKLLENKNKSTPEPVTNVLNDSNNTDSLKDEKDTEEIEASATEMMGEAKE